MESSSRRLVAILFSDIVGYTAMMKENEQLGKSKAKTYRKILEEKVAKHHGEVVQHYGDGSLSIFQSSVEAVRCAKEIQLEVKEHDIPLRIGIHKGDITIEGKDVFGDGINVASRIESLGIPGLSRTPQSCHFSNIPQYSIYRNVDILKV